ncbi:MAG: hypothetical protein RL196_1403 [Actinomycetota bacterium]|jgi:hypothetical protein
MSANKQTAKAVIAAKNSTARARANFLEDQPMLVTQADLDLMPDPLELLPSIATLIVEVISGARPVDHLASIVSDRVYEKLRARQVIKARADAAAGIPKLVPKFAVTRVHTESPALGIIESVVLLSSKARTRAVTIRLEPIHSRWRATDVSVL